MGKLNFKPKGENHDRKISCLFSAQRTMIVDTAKEDFGVKFYHFTRDHKMHENAAPTNAQQIIKEYGLNKHLHRYKKVN